MFGSGLCLVVLSLAWLLVLDGWRIQRREADRLVLVTVYSETTCTIFPTPTFVVPQRMVMLRHERFLKTLNRGNTAIPKKHPEDHRLPKTNTDNTPDSPQTKPTRSSATKFRSPPPNIKQKAPSARRRVVYLLSAGITYASMSSISSSLAI